MPDFDDRLGVPGAPVCLHNGAKGNSRGCNPIVVHLVQCLLQLHHVTSLSEDVQQGVEDDLINILLLLVNEGLNEANPPAHAALIRGGLEALRQDGDEVLVCLGSRDASGTRCKHNLETFPCWDVLGLFRRLEVSIPTFLRFHVMISLYKSLKKR